MSPLEVCFWLLVAGVVYPYVVYPIVLVLHARLRRCSVHPAGPLPSSYSFVLAAHNEAAAIERRLRELLDLKAQCPIPGEIIVVCDGCSDDTAQLARSYEHQGVRVLELADKHGKAAALSEACVQATGEILVFGDVRQTWDAAALPLLLDNFADPAVGAVSGELVVESGPGTLAGVGLYWRLEKCLRRLESRVGKAFSVTGAISAVRRSLFDGIPAGTLLDDLYWPLCVAQRGYRIVHDERARAYDRLPPRVRDEFRRKTRTLCGNFQLMTRLPGALLPWHNPVWVQFVSHKVLRLGVPWLLIGMLLLSTCLPGAIYRVLFCCQAAFYALALWGLVRQSRWRLAAAASSFVVLNGAAWLAFWMWAGGQANAAWHKAHYEPVRATGGETVPA